VAAHQDDAFVGFEAVHFHQQLVQGLFALVVSAAQAGTTLTADGIDLVNKDDAGSVFLALFEEIADAACAHAYEHFHEIRARNGEEGYCGFTGNRAGQESFARSRGTDQEHALGNTSPNF